MVQTLEKLQKTCTLLLTPTRVTFILNADMVVWAGMNAVRRRGMRGISNTAVLTHSVAWPGMARRRMCCVATGTGWRV